jgi:hypothetical protein
VSFAGSLEQIQQGLLIVSIQLSRVESRVMQHNSELLKHSHSRYAAANGG